MPKVGHPPAFLFYPDDFSSDGKVEAMTTEEVGAYMLLLCKSWRESPVASLPSDDLVLARWARLTPERWSVCKPSVLAPFKFGPDSRWHQKRLRLEYDKLVAIRRERKKAANARWNKDIDANALHKQSIPIPSPSSFPKKEEERENIPPAKTAGFRPTAEFLTFWENYPRKLGKHEALKAWLRRGCEGRLGEVLASLKSWGEVEWKGCEARFIPHAATWLNADRWKETPQRGNGMPKGESLEEKRKRLERELGDGQRSGAGSNQHPIANAH